MFVRVDGSVHLIYRCRLTTVNIRKIETNLLILRPQVTDKVFYFTFFFKELCFSQNQEISFLLKPIKFFQCHGYVFIFI